MEALDVEAVAERAPGPLAQRAPAGLADLVAGRLARPDAIALDLGRDRAFLVAEGFDHVADRLLAAPALVVEAGVDDAAGGAEHEALQIAELAERVVLVDAHLVGQRLGIEAPALGIDRIERQPAERRDAGRFLGERDLVVMAGHRLVIGEGRQGPFRPFGGVAQVDVISAGPRAVERRRLVIAARRAGLDRRRHAADLAGRARQPAEIVGQAAPDRRPSAR